MMNLNNSNSVAGQYYEVKSIKCNCCGKQAMVKSCSICQECELEMYGTISGYDVEDYNDMMELHIGKETETVNYDALMTRLKFGDKFVIRMNSKFYGWQWKAAKLFEKELEYVREFETFEQAEKIAKKYVNQCTEYQILTVNQAMSM